MASSPKRQAREPLWSQPTTPMRRRMPTAVSAWLLDPASLTARLKGLCGAGFRVRLLRQKWRRPQACEAQRLGMLRGEFALVREVHLYCGERVLVYARTVIPRSTLKGRTRSLARLGTRPLGEVLFADPNMQRGPLEIARIPRDIPDYRAFLGEGLAGDAAWGRRSVFRLSGRSLLVSEIFLPGMPEFPG
ncbi:MAG: chorismate lyase [Chromatiales bacterium]|nr:chorismate lyase [Chromatiales bacterium]